MLVMQCKPRRGYTYKFKGECMYLLVIAMFGRGWIQTSSTFSCIVMHLLEGVTVNL